MSFLDLFKGDKTEEDIAAARARPMSPSVPSPQLPVQQQAPEVSAQPPQPQPSEAEKLSDWAADTRGDVSIAHGIAKMFGGKPDTAAAHKAIDSTVADKRNKHKYQLDSDMADPTSKQSQLYRTLAQARMLKEVPKEQHAEFMQYLDSLPASELKKFAATNDQSVMKRFSPTSLEGPDGKTVAGKFDHVTGEYTTSDFTRGWAPKSFKDPITGENILTSGHGNEITRPGNTSTPGGADPQANTNQLKPLPGETPENFKIRLAGAKSHATKEGSTQASNEDLARKAVAARTKRKAISNRWSQLYDQASKQGEGVLGMGGTGPIKGRFSEKLVDWGFSPGTATARLVSGVAADANAYIKEITGAAMSEPEAERIMRVMPRAAMDKELFEAKKEELLAELDRVVAERQQVAAQLTPEEVGMMEQYIDQYPDKTYTQIVNSYLKQKARASGQ